MTRDQKEHCVVYTFCVSFVQARLYTQHNAKRLILLTDLHSLLRRLI